FEQFGAYIGHAFYGKFENGLSFLVGEVLVVGHRFIRSGTEGTAGFHVEVGAAGAIAAEDAVLYAVSFGAGFEQYSAGAIAKDDTGGAVVVIDDGAHFISADHHYFFIAAAFDQGSAGGKGIQET